MPPRDDRGFRGCGPLGCVVAIVFWGYVAAVLAWWLIFGEG
jgi:hypothetical protein